MSPLISQLKDDLDPGRKKGRQEKTILKKPLEIESYRLNPKDDVLEKRVILAVAVLWVPVVPDSAMPYSDPEVTWKYWFFLQGHRTFLNPHRTVQETF